MTGLLPIKGMESIKKMIKNFYPFFNDPKLQYYIEEYNNARREMREAMRSMDKWRKLAKNYCGIDIANDRSYN